MNKSESLAKIAPAITKAFRNIGAAPKGAKNPFFHSKYADLGSVMETCKLALLDEGISVLQPVGFDDNGGYVETVLLHESGEWISDKMRITCAKEKDPQSYGSAVTYARRYGLQSMVFVPAADDDGNAGAGKGEPSKPKTSADALEEALKAQGRTVHEFMEAMRYKEKIPKAATDFYAMKPETAQKFLEEIGYVIDDIIEWKALKQP